MLSTTDHTCAIDLSKEVGTEREKHQAIVCLQEQRE